MIIHTTSRSIKVPETTQPLIDKADKLFTSIIRCTRKMYTPDGFRGILSPTNIIWIEKKTLDKEPNLWVYTSDFTISLHVDNVEEAYQKFLSPPMNFKFYEDEYAAINLSLISEVSPVEPDTDSDETNEDIAKEKLLARKKV